jgi:hypothetical protein
MPESPILTIKELKQKEKSHARGLEGVAKHEARQRELEAEERLGMRYHSLTPGRPRLRDIAIENLEAVWYLTHTGREQAESKLGY